MKNLTKFVFMAIVFGLIGLSADTAFAQKGWKKEGKEAQKEYRREVREARKEYRQERKEWRKDRRYNGYYNGRKPQGRAYGYYNRRPYVGWRRQRQINRGNINYMPGREYRVRPTRRGSVVRPLR